VSISLADLYPPGANIRTITGSSLRDYLRTRSLSGQVRRPLDLNLQTFLFFECSNLHIGKDAFKRSHG
jgi:hypothetical protein